MFQKEKNFRIKIALLVICLVLVIIVLRVFYIQIFKYDDLKSLADDLWSRNLPITADRGSIYDRNGKVLATNLTTTSLVIIPSQVIDKESTARKLSVILGVDYLEMYGHVSKKTSIERVHPEGRRLGRDVSEEIASLNLSGVYLLRESMRYYPNDELLSHTLGYVGIDNQGLSGLELVYDDYLTGEDGSIKYFSDGLGKPIDTNQIYEQPTSGVDLQLTIDLDIQKSIEKELDNVYMKYAPDNALIMVMDPNNGEILGMGSRPDFNPNSYQEYSISEINRNLPIWMTYEPGSTFKIITLAASIEEGTIDLFNEHFYDSGSVSVGGARIKCWKAGGHGDQTMLEVVQNSCNPGFVEMGRRLGKETLFSYINNFGFGSKTGVDLNGESNGILFNIDRVGPLELATTSFGQGISVTPIQQVSAVSAAINGGDLYEPFLVKNFLEPETNSIIKSVSPNLVRDDVISDETSGLVRYTLETVVDSGTGKNAYIENYRIGGKTGTAQKVENGAYMVGNYIVSFMGFMPADKPEYVVYVAIDNPKGVTQYGGTVSAPIAKNIFSDIIGIRDISESLEVTPREYTWLDQKYIELPDVVGLTKSEADSLLKSFKVEYSGGGDNIIYQSPKGGIYVKEGSSVKILLSN